MHLDQQTLHVVRICETLRAPRLLQAMLGMHSIIKRVANLLGLAAHEWQLFAEMVQALGPHWYNITLPCL